MNLNCFMLTWKEVKKHTFSQMYSMIATVKLLTIYQLQKTDKFEYEQVFNIEKLMN